MEHRQKMVLVTANGPVETMLPTTVRLHKGEEVSHDGHRYTVSESSHEMSTDGEVMTTTHFVRPMEGERSVDMSSFEMKDLKLS